MRIELEPPFSGRWKCGYLRQPIRGKQRALVDLVATATDRTTISYARYIASVRLGRFLSPDEEADHINEDGYDDRPENIQVLQRSEHRRKSAAHRPRAVILILKCRYCGKLFQRDRRHVTGRPHVYCSRSCKGHFNKGGRNKKPIVHGTHHGYRRKCRCQPCRDAHTEAMRLWRKAKALYGAVPKRLTT